MRKSPAGYVRVTALPAACGDALWGQVRPGTGHPPAPDRRRPSQHVPCGTCPAGAPDACRAPDRAVRGDPHRRRSHRRCDLAAAGIRHAQAQLRRCLGSTAGGICKRTRPGKMCSPPIQGEFLGALIEKERLRWNAAFSSAAVVVPEIGPLPSRQLPGGAQPHARVAAAAPAAPAQAQLGHGLGERCRVVAR